MSKLHKLMVVLIVLLAVAVLGNELLCSIERHRNITIEPAEFHRPDSLAACGGDSVKSSPPQASNKPITAGNDAKTEDGAEQVEPEPASKSSPVVTFDYRHIRDNSGSVMVVMDKDDTGEWGHDLTVFSFPLGRPERQTTLFEGRHWVEVVGDAGTWVSEPFEATTGSTTNIILQQPAEAAQSIAVTVVDAETGAPLEDACLSRVGGTRCGTYPKPKKYVVALTDKNGLAVLKGQVAARKQYDIHKHGYVRTTLTSDVAAGGETNLGVVRLDRQPAFVEIVLVGEEFSNYEITMRLIDGNTFGSHSRKLLAGIEPGSELDWGKRDVQPGVARVFRGIEPGRMYALSVWLIDETADGERRTGGIVANEYFVPLGETSSSWEYTPDSIKWRN